ncbi:hypothetical protein [Megasphaera sp.]|uniref:hypothetical protein n=1 Tax=Megasphaera sp. TaxID=2023260 RepID=UPI003F7E9953
MYLPQRKEVEAIVQQNKTLIIACLLLFLVALAGSWMVYRHYDRQAASDDHDVSRTVQSIENDNQRAREQLVNASAEIEQARRQLDDVADSISSSQRTVDENKKLIADSQRLIDSSQQRITEAERIFADIDRTNQ